MNIIPLLRSRCFITTSSSYSRTTPCSLKLYMTNWKPVPNSRHPDAHNRALGIPKPASAYSLRTLPPFSWSPYHDLLLHSICWQTVAHFNNIFHTASKTSHIVHCLTVLHSAAGRISHFPNAFAFTLC